MILLWGITLLVVPLTFREILVLVVARVTSNAFSKMVAAFGFPMI